jgi:hypothetical protein
MYQAMTIEEIERSFDSEWVLLADPEVDDQGNVIRGHVVIHSKNRDEVSRMAVKLRLPHTASLYTGRIPEGTAVIL